MVDTPNSLLKNNPELVSSEGVYQDTASQIRETSLTHYLVSFCNEIFDATKDLSLFSIELEDQATTDELRAALSPAPYNYLLALTIKGSLDNVLDLSQDLGGVSHFLSSKVKKLDSIKVDIGRARLSAHRCRSLDNVTVISQDLDALTLPKQYYDLIVLDDLKSLSLNPEELQQLFSQLQTSLSESGLLIFNCENKTRLNRWFSAGDNSIPYNDLYQQQDDLRFSQSNINQLLTDSKIEHANLFASFSNDKQISNLFSQDYTVSNPHFVNHLNRIGLVDNSDINEYLLFKNLPKETQLFEYATRYIVIAGNNLADVNQACENNFSHFPGNGRQAQWRTITESKRGSNKVTKTPLMNEKDRFKLIQARAKSDNIHLLQDVSTKPFHQGPMLLDNWLQAVIKADVIGLRELISEYAAWLKKLADQDGFTDIAYDLLPFNIIVKHESQERQFHVIDSEWQLKTEYGPDFVLFRALFWFAFENKALLKSLADKIKTPTLGLFILHFMDKINTLQELDGFVALEENVQRQIGKGFRNKSVEYALNQLFDQTNSQTIPTQPACQISWGNNDLIFDETKSVHIDWNKSSNSQMLSSPLSAIKSYTTLRVDPIASTGLFHFSKVVLRDKDKKIIWQCKSSSEITLTSTFRNLETVEGSDQVISFVALNDDPYFLFDLSNIKGLNKVANVELTLALIHDQFYDKTLSTLSRIVNEQNQALSEQADGLNEKLAEVEALKFEFDHVTAHRAGIKSKLYEAQQSHAEYVEEQNKVSQELSQKIQHLSAHVANLEQAQMRRPLSRLKRLVLKVIGK